MGGSYLMRPLFIEVLLLMDEKVLLGSETGGPKRESSKKLLNLGCLGSN